MSTNQPSDFDVEHLNQKFADSDPKDILLWCIENIPEGLIQTTAFGATGMVILNVLYNEIRPMPAVPVLFLDTLHHFPETIDLVNQSIDFFDLNLTIIKPYECDSRNSFNKKYGEALWRKDIDKFHYVTKVEPLQRGLQELNVKAWITGRRRDQSSSRSQIHIFERDKAQRLKVNPLAGWTYKNIWQYIMDRNLIYNSLYDRGYSSIGDEPLTTPVKFGENERSGRWRGTERTECGIHNAI